MKKNEKMKNGNKQNEKKNEKLFLITGEMRNHNMRYFIIYNFYAIIF